MNNGAQMALNEDTREPNDKSQGGNTPRYRRLHRDIMNQFSVKECLLFTMKQANEGPPNSLKMPPRMPQPEPQPLP